MLLSRCKRHWQAFKTAIFNKPYFISNNTSIPLELLTIILYYLAYHQRLRNRRVCRRWNHAMRQQRIVIMRPDTIRNLADQTSGELKSLFQPSLSQTAAKKMFRLLSVDQDKLEAIIFHGEVTLKERLRRWNRISQLRQQMDQEFSTFCSGFVWHLDDNILNNRGSRLCSPSGPILKFVNIGVFDVLPFAYICGKLHRPVLLHDAVLGGDYANIRSRYNVLLHGDHILRRVRELSEGQLALDRSIHRGKLGHSWCFSERPRPGCPYKSITLRRPLPPESPYGLMTVSICMRTGSPYELVDFYGLDFFPLSSSSA